MTTPLLQRRPSLLFSGYEKVASSTEAPTKEGESASATNKPRILSIDDLDMISLPTHFDRQMLLGSPMYLDPKENHQTTTKNRYQNGCNRNDSLPTNNIDPLLHMECPKGCAATDNLFRKIGQLRTKYITGSLQDNASNIKNDLDNWFLYPKPLPKFWKFAKDKRFQDSESDLESAEDDANDETIEFAKNAAKNGYYLSTVDNDEFYVDTSQKSAQDTNLHQKGINLPHYTGEFFDLAKYKEEYDKHTKDSACRNSSCKPENIPTFQQFKEDLELIAETVQARELVEISEKRLEYLLDKFELFQHLSSKAEILQNKYVPYRDFYNCRKVDRDMLLSGCIAPRPLSEFIWEKLNSEADRIVYKSLDGEEISLCQIFKYGCSEGEDPATSIGLKIIDDEFLDWYKDFYLKNIHLIPSQELWETRLKGKEFKFYLLAKTFLEFDNYIEGEYFAEVFIKHVIHNLEKSKYQLAQISVDFQFYETDEPSWWLKFFNWLIKWNLASYNIRWNVQFSRIYTKLYSYQKVRNFQDYLDRIFTPLLEDAAVKNVGLQFFLSTVCCFDLIIEETDDYLWKEFADVDLLPSQWEASGDNPTVAYYMYYIFASLAHLNNIRRHRSQNTITLRNGSSTLRNRTSQTSKSLYFTEHVESLACNILLANGGLLQGRPVWTGPAPLQYAFFLFQIPIIMAPLSSVSEMSSEANRVENKLIFEGEGHITGSTIPQRDITLTDESTYTRNPFMKMFQMGFKISLSSKSILFNSSYTAEPIMEEYSVAASIYLLNASDLCELARTSVLCSGYEGWYKRHWIGVTVKPTNDLKETVGYVDCWYDNSISEKENDTAIRHNVPLIRRKYRQETWTQEWEFVDSQF